MRRVELGMLIGTKGEVAGKLMALDPEIFAVMQSLVPDDLQVVRTGFAAEMDTIIDGLRAGRRPSDPELMWAMSCGIKGMVPWKPEEGETTGYLLRIDVETDRAEVIRLHSSMKDLFDEPQGRAKLWHLTAPPPEEG
jgi:hypothetical protein